MAGGRSEDDRGGKSERLTLSTLKERRNQEKYRLLRTPSSSLRFWMMSYRLLLLVFSFQIHVVPGPTTNNLANFFLDVFGSFGWSMLTISDTD
jgi:hypothetical protein